MNELDIRELRQRANKGDPESMFRLGSMLVTGRYFAGGLFLAKHLGEGLRLIKGAGAKGYPPATEFLAARFNLTTTNEPMTAGDLRKVQDRANRGDAESQYRYGSMLITGRCFKSGLFVDQEIEEGVSWIKKAAVQEYKPAIDFLSSRDKTDPHVTFLKAKLEHLEHKFTKGQSRQDWRRFLITVFAGVTTYFLTQFLFGRGFKDATIVGIVTAVIIGVLIKLFSSDSTDGS